MCHVWCFHSNEVFKSLNASFFLLSFDINIFNRFSFLKHRDYTPSISLPLFIGDLSISSLNKEEGLRYVGDNVNVQLSHNPNLNF